MTPAILSARVAALLTTCGFPATPYVIALAERIVAGGGR